MMCCISFLFQCILLMFSGARARFIRRQSLDVFYCVRRIKNCLLQERGEHTVDVSRRWS